MPARRRSVSTLAPVAVQSPEVWYTWFRARGWAPLGFQQQAWDAYLAGASGLIHSSTGAGKSYAAWGGPLLEWLSEARSEALAVEPLRVLWITPLRALASDTEAALLAPVQALGLPWRVESRTGDTSSAVRQRQRVGLPTALITTPESLSLLLARPDFEQACAQLRCVIVDEWHELLGSKRGSQLELCLARLRHWRPALQTWGLSATLGDVQTAAATLVGHGAAAPRVIQGELTKSYAIDALLPAKVERFPWAGHLGLSQLGEVLARLDQCRSALVFTNTRAQTEIWYQAILRARPEWAGQMALHHGSLDQDIRRWVENGLRAGTLRAVVCTSSLDLGVDFSPVDAVIQVGSPKGVARLLQRAGRSGHQPGATSRVLCVPTHALELIEVAALRDAMSRGEIESREAIAKPLDVLVQHAVTIALGPGFVAAELLREIRQATSFAEVTDEEWAWVLDFIHRGGATLQAYPDFRRVDMAEGRYVVQNPAIARRHRMSIGTISSDTAMIVQYMNGKRLGTIEESFLGRLKPGEVFVFSGKLLQLVKIHELRAWVKPAKSGQGSVPRWQGGRMALSTQLAQALRQRFQAAAEGRYEGAEMAAVRPILELQGAWSRIPGDNELLMEHMKSREGHHVFVYPFEGRLVHQGLANLFAERLSRCAPTTFSMAVNDYGFELLSPTPIAAMADEQLLSLECLNEDILAGLNSAELARRQFRDIARIAGLVFQGYPGAVKTARQVQASSSLIYDVFCEFDPQHPLLLQARREVLDQQLDAARLKRCLMRLQARQVFHQEIARPTPLAFPLLVDRLREKLSTESLEDRVRRLVAPLERAAGL